MDVVDESPVNLDAVKWESLQVGKRRVTRTEVVERKHTAEFLERVDETVGLGITRNRRRLGYLETDKFPVDFKSVCNLYNVTGDLVIIDRVAG